MKELIPSIIPTETILAPLSKPSQDFAQSGVNCFVFSPAGDFQIGNLLLAHKDTAVLFPFETTTEVFLEVDGTVMV